MEYSCSFFSRNYLLKLVVLSLEFQRISRHRQPKIPSESPSDKQLHKEQSFVSRKMVCRLFALLISRFVLETRICHHKLES
jgi:hypothetical protein